MKQAHLTMPELSLIANTRVALGGGVALLFADRLTDKERRTVGWGLFLLGAMTTTTIPLMKMVLDKRH